MWSILPQHRLHAPRLSANNDSNRCIVTQGPTSVPAAPARARCAIGLLAFPMAKTPGLLVRPCSSLLAKPASSTLHREAARSDAAFNRAAIQAASHGISAPLSVETATSRSSL